MDENDWAQEAEDNLIDLMEANDCLYNTGTKAYHDQDKKLYVKETIARRLKVTLKDLEKKWKSLRTQYRRAVAVRKAAKSGSGSSATALTRRQFELLRRLAFLAPYTKGAEGVVSSMDGDSDDHSDEESADNGHGVGVNVGVAVGVNNGVNNDVDNNINGHRQVLYAVPVVDDLPNVPDIGDVADDSGFVTDPQNAHVLQAIQAVQNLPTEPVVSVQNTTASAEPTPGPSGVSTRSKKSAGIPVQQFFKPPKRRKRSTAAAAGGSASQVAVDVGQVNVPIQIAEPLQITAPVSPRGPTPPAEGQAPLTIASPPPKSQTKRGRKKTPAVSVEELRQLLEEEEAAVAAAEAGVDQPFSSLDESPKVPKKTPAKRKVNAVDEERVLALREVRSTLQAHRQRPPPPPYQEKEMDEISLWAGQCERKIRKLSDTMLQEDLMDHISSTIKRASRGQWNVTPTTPSAAHFKPVQPTSPAASLQSFQSRQLPMNTAGAHSMSVPTSSAQMLPVSGQSQFPTPHQGPMQNAMTPMTDEQFSAFASWFKPTGNSPGMPQGPQIHPVSGPVARYVSGPSGGDYTNLPGN